MYVKYRLHFLFISKEGAKNLCKTHTDTVFHDRIGVSEGIDIDGFGNLSLCIEYQLGYL